MRSAYASTEDYLMGARNRSSLFPPKVDELDTAFQAGATHTQNIPAGAGLDLELRAVFRRGRGPILDGEPFYLFYLIRAVNVFTQRSQLPLHGGMYWLRDITRQRRPKLGSVVSLARRFLIERMNYHPYVPGCGVGEF